MKVNFDEVFDVVKNNNGKVIILNGTACVGKTTTAVKLGEYLSYNLNIPILYFSPCISKEQLEGARIANKSENFIIDDSVGMTINDIKTKILRLKKERKIKYVIIDEIQLINYYNKECRSFKEQYQKIIDELVKISKELNITIFITRLINIPKRNQDYYKIEVLE